MSNKTKSTKGQSGKFPEATSTTKIKLSSGDKIWFCENGGSPIEGMVLSPLPKDISCPVKIVIIGPYVVSRDPRISTGKVLKISPDQIVAVDEKKDNAVLEIKIVDGKLELIRRVDGSTKPVIIKIEKFTSKENSKTKSEILMVDHTGFGVG